MTRPDGKVVRGSAARWGKKAEERFLVELTMSANVQRAAAAAGFSTTAVYRRRLTDRHFAAAWDAAIETGKARVQAFLVEAATRTFDPDELPIGDDTLGAGGHPPDGRYAQLAKVSISEAINIAKLRAAAPMWPAGEAEAPGEAELDEIRERILDKLQRVRERDERELSEAGWRQWVLPPRAPGGEDDTVWLPPDHTLAGPDDA